MLEDRSVKRRSRRWVIMARSPNAQVEAAKGLSRAAGGTGYGAGRTARSC